MEIKNILVPVDFSKCSNNALNYAIKLAQSTGATLTLLNCYTVHVHAAEITVDLRPVLAKDYQKEAEQNFSDLKEVTKDLLNVPHHILIKLSFIVDGIHRTAEEVEADLIVMGTKGASNRIDAFFGSNTYDAIKNSKKPILAIPEGAKFQPIKNILFAADFEKISDLRVLSLIKLLAKLFKAKIEIMHVGQGWSELSMHQSKEAAAIVDYFCHTDHSFRFVKDQLDVEEVIEDCLEERNHELLVLIPRKHLFPGSLFQKRVTRKTAMQTSIPLLTISDSDEQQ